VISPIRTMFAALCVIAAAPPASARHLTLNDTGATECIDNHGDKRLDCAASRQDAAYGRDVTDLDPDDGMLGFSFRKVCRSGQLAGEGSCPSEPILGSGPDNWACTFDNVTQLTWEVKTDDHGLHRDRKKFTNRGHWARDDPRDIAWLVDATNAEVLCGATNWRVPEVFELQSIVSYGSTAGHVDRSFFPYISGWDYWTRAKLVEDAKSAWFVNFNQSRIYFRDRNCPSPGFGCGAVLVHGASHSLSHDLGQLRFIPSPDGTEVTDSMTGLVWRRCVEGMVWSTDAQTCIGTASGFRWADLLKHAKANRHGGWRMPNIKELTSIVDYKRFNPAFDPLIFPNGTAETYTSSTPEDNGPNSSMSAYCVSAYNGFVQPTLVSQSFPIFYLRMVRRGRE
jgi:hypothetical protein